MTPKKYEVLKKETVTPQPIKFYILEGEKEVGRAFLFFVKNELHDEPYGLLEDVFVQPEFRGQGRADALVDAVIEAAKDSGCYKLIATSRYGREHVHKIYLAKGFVEHGKEFRIDFEKQS